MRSALFLTPEVPFPSVGGGALRGASLLHYLAGRFAVDVLVFRETGSPHPGMVIPRNLVRDVFAVDLPFHARHALARCTRNLGRLLRRLPPLVDRFSGFDERITELLRGRRYDLAIIEHFWCAPYWKVIAPVSGRTILDLHNVESVLHQRCAQIETPLASYAHRMFQAACRELEEQWLPRYNSLLVASECDAELVRAITPESHVAVYPNSLPTVPLPARREEDVVVFSGNLEYHPNVSAVRFFRKSIWPELRQRWPQLVWRLVGKNPHAVRSFTKGDARIQVTGAVPDALAELAKAKVAVVPLLAGSGTRFKIMEAWAAGVPVVSTRLGAEGLPVSDGEDILLADEPDAFQEAVSRLLGSPGLRERIGQAGRALFVREFTWERAWAKLVL